MKDKCKFEKLPHEKKENLESLGTIEMSESLSELYFWEAEGYGDYTISELIDLINDANKVLRKGFSMIEG